MADDITLNSMTGGSVVATDDIASKHYQRIKLIHGAEGVNDGDVAAANGLPVKTVGSATTIETTTTPLLTGTSYTTASFDTAVNGHGFTLSAKADQSGHTYHEQSINGTDWISADDYAYVANSGHHEEHISHMRYSRYKFTNDSGTNQTTFVFSVVQRHMDGFGTLKISPTQNAVTQGTDEPWTFIGNKQNNFAAPGGTNFGTLPGVATAAAPSHTEGNQVGVSTTLTGDTRVTLDGEAVVLGAGTAGIGKLTANSGVDIGDVDVLSLPAISIAAAQTLATVTTVGTVTTITNAVTTTPGGNVAHGASDSGNPIKVGAKAETALSTITPVTDGQRTDLYADSDGVQYSKTFSEGDLITERVSNTDGASTAFTNFAATASARNLIYAASLFNASATGGYVDFRDGTAGAILYTVPLPAGGGAVLPMGAMPYFKTTANTALAYDVSAALTTVYISLTGRKSKVT